MTLDSFLFFRRTCGAIAFVDTTFHALALALRSLAFSGRTRTATKTLLSSASPSVAVMAARRACQSAGRDTNGRFVTMLNKKE